jgi:Ca2+-binding EF-hand superfamily protein
LFDLDKSGTIDTEEVANAMNNQGLHERNPVLYEVISSLCEVGGQIDENTFIETICDKLGNIKTREGINRLFELYVTDQGEEINFDIIKRVSHELGETLNDDELKEMMHHVHILNKCGT